MMRRHLPAIVALAFVVVAHAMVIPWLDRQDLVGQALALSDDDGIAVMVGLVGFLLLRLFVIVMLPGIATFVLGEAILDASRARREAIRRA